MESKNEFMGRKRGSESFLNELINIHKFFY